jgi:hypothetical protein
MVVTYLTAHYELAIFKTLSINYKYFYSNLIVYCPIEKIDKKCILFKTSKNNKLITFNISAQLKL